ncbi:RND transporter [Paenibacillus timonensis]|uniref:Efflux RND transporter periplasmic adaptor subunit n=1 Tax=Paenibacillus timonensis TaxID=225915 RepID=A0ABW3SDL0_9BACL|nr:RND transporter [Paenibacillus timonensis]MCH1641425.1 RND transporter [Paenibacillus timonensis]
MEFEKDQTDRKRKKMIFTAFMALMGGLLFFTFFSNTLQSMTLPKVRTNPAAASGLTYRLTGSGILKPANPAGWKVRKVLVKEGTAVKEGQKLVLYDSAAAERELEDELAQFKKQRIALETIQDQFIEATVGGDETGLREAKRELETRKLDLQVQERKIEGLREQLSRQRELVAPFDGVVAEVNAVAGLASASLPDVVVSSGSAGYRVDITGDAGVIDRLGIATGQAVGVEVAATAERPAHRLEGTVEEIANADSRLADSAEDGTGPAAVPQRRLRIQVAAPDLKGGEQVSVRLEQTSSEQGWVVPNEAIRRDGDTRFIFKVEEQRGALGNVFVARKVPIEIMGANEEETMIPADLLYEGERIILESSEPLQDGNRVRLQ